MADTNKPSASEKPAPQPKPPNIIASPPPTSNLCTSCNNPFKTRCSRCHNARYCSPACQKKDWQYHKTVCPSYASLPPRPSPKHSLALHLPVDSCPAYIWLEHESPIYYHTTQNPKTYVGTNHMCRTISFDRYRPLHRLLGFNMAIWHADAFLLDGSAVNESVREMLGPEVAHRWRGGFLVQGFDGGCYDDEQKPVDLDTMVMAPIVDFLRFTAKYHDVGYDFGWDGMGVAGE
ncbi:hypothetical protein P280DRAFT_197642 [Massarina eburnea CBS 473.64]|uniref:MYND-type domain-containing protein n=1 Tax=Massarina eburnea CBS 473.64 TaxID=1395130 RepID=A0A6A6RIR7_9PLEO|nr:hypothetical protein P280DRAFT_197642 [Massarina eburnea CBS 473.64]